jgi:hypothetical protein
LPGRFHRQASFVFGNFLRWYNSFVPTPFYHISVAVNLLEQVDLGESAHNFLNSFRGEFLFGTTAPDVQVVSGQKREDTHFFTIPVRQKDRSPWQRLLMVYPQLKQMNGMPPKQIAFLAGYMCHLQADWLWVREIFSPIFGSGGHWGSWKQRLYLHNVLRAYLDNKIVDRLVGSTGTSLRQVEPRGWLAFVEDGYLCSWRDYLYPQLEPGADIQTVEVFASRHGMEPGAFYRLIESEEEMENEVFSHLSRQQLDVYRQRVLEENMCLVKDYLEPFPQKFLASFQQE